MNNDNEFVINSLIKISKDGELGFIKAAEKTNDPSLRSILMERAKGCEKAVQVLQEHAAKLGIETGDSGSIMGALHRGWIEVLSALTNHDDYAILAECERGEEAAKLAYLEALSKNLTAEIRTTIEHQYKGVLDNYQLIYNLKEQCADLH